MPGHRITKRVVDCISPTDRDHVVWDADLPGFGVRVRPFGSKSYLVQYRAGSGRQAQQRRLTLGPVGKLTPEEARSLARRAIGAVANGEDPAKTRAVERKTLTISELTDRFMKEHVELKRKTATAVAYRVIARMHVKPHLGTVKVENVSRADVARVHLAMKSIPGQANRLLAFLSSMYGFAGRRGLVPENFNPARGVEKFPEQRKERFLTPEELDRLGAALREAETVGIAWEPNPAKNKKHAPKKENRIVVLSLHVTAAVRLLIFTGAQLREILNLRWEFVDFDRGLLLLPDRKTGRKAIVLNARALSVLQELPRNGALVVAGENPERARADLNRPSAAVKKQAALLGLRISRP